MCQYANVPIGYAVITYAAGKIGTLTYWHIDTLLFNSFKFLQFFRWNEFIELIARPYFIQLHGETLSFFYGLHGLQIYTSLLKCGKQRTGSRTGHQQLITHIQLSRFHQKLRNPDIIEIPDSFPHINFAFRSGRTIIFRPFKPIWKARLPMRRSLNGTNVWKQCSTVAFGTVIT